MSLLVVVLQFWRYRSLLHVFCEIIGAPTLARAGHKEPVVVKSDLEAANLIVAVTYLRLLLPLSVLLIVERR